MGATATDGAPLGNACLSVSLELIFILPFRLDCEVKILTLLKIVREIEYVLLYCLRVKVLKVLQWQKNLQED